MQLVVLRCSGHVPPLSLLKDVMRHYTFFHDGRFQESSGISLLNLRPSAFISIRCDSAESRASWIADRCFVWVSELSDIFASARSDFIASIASTSTWTLIFPREKGLSAFWSWFVAAPRSRSDSSRPTRNVVSCCQLSAPYGYRVEYL